MCVSKKVDRDPHRKQPKLDCDLPAEKHKQDGIRTGGSRLKPNKMQLHNRTWGLYLPGRGRGCVCFEEVIHTRSSRNWDRGPPSEKNRETESLGDLRSFFEPTDVN